MKIVVKSNRVRDNLEVFKNKIQEWARKANLRESPAYLNQKSGEISFKQPSSNSDWKEVIVFFTPNGSDRGFALLEKASNRSEFHCDQLQPLAHLILSETFHVLNGALSKAKQEDVYLALEELAHLEVIASNPVSKLKDLIHDAWHSSSRMEAEQLLKNAPEGRFLFRKDEYAKILEEEFALENKQQVQCITLTFVNYHHHVEDKTIVLKDNRFYLYDDDPSLSGENFGSIEEVLDSLGLIEWDALLHY